MRRTGQRRREIGAVGTSVRIAAGTALIALPIVLDGVTPWDLAGALVAGPLIAAAAALSPVRTARRGRVFARGRAEVTAGRPALDG